MNELLNPVVNLNPFVKLNPFMKRSLAALMLVMMALGLAACGGDEPEPEAAEQAEVAETAPEPGTERRRRPQAEPVAPEDLDDRSVPRLAGQLEDDQQGFGLAMVIDASDEQAFRESLRLIADESSAQEYRDLDNALRFLHFYSPQVMTDRERLHQLVNGMTGEEIIEMAAKQNRRASRQR